ncbi:hypothetical protein NQ317_019095 [Molorchus minor]|uniref:Reverse transcriptase n=1 Tax=Molorchus minor TaxID=1323400 RepID=A0ABQ9JL35_9CUCU|nr:hypothetical protein NQ317_019095 [Molorchus minor]
MSLRVACAYRTVSTGVAAVIAGMIPIDLKIEERNRIRAYRLEGEETEEARARARAETLQKWQERWERDPKGQWTHKLIQNVRGWVNRKEGETEYETTQFLTGHGNFGTYLHRIGKKPNDLCLYCEARDSPEHTMFECDRWTRERQEINAILGTVGTPENLIELITIDGKKWKRTMEKVKMIMKIKEQDYRAIETIERN